MLDIKPLTKDSKYWNETIAFAEDCSWSAGPFLADKMRKNDFLKWERVFAALEDERPIGYCTFCKTDELPEKYGFYPFIGFVFVDEAHRGHRVSEKLIKSVIIYAKELGFDCIYIMSGEKGLYEKYGFEKIGDYETVFGTVDQLFKMAIK